jgi:cation:H+ antiporter
VVNQRWIITFLFIVGGLLLLASVHPFYENTIHLAMLFGIPAYFLFQWIAPMLSEFPEFVTILYWGKTGREQLGLTNAISSKVNQWTLLLAMIPVVFAYATYSMGNFSWSTPFDDKQRVEILLTSAQSLFAAACLIDLRFQAWQAWTILGMWAAQLVDPLVDPYIELWLPFLTNTPFGTEAYIREWFVWVYLALVVVVVWHERGRFDAFPGFAAEWREHIRPGAPRVGEPAPGEEPHVGGP